MRIAVNTRFLLPHRMEGFGWVTYEVTKRLVENHPEHMFILFFDRPYDPKFIFGKNVIPVVLNPPARHPILFIIWFEIAVKRALKKYKADIFFSPDGYLSLSSKIPQIPIIHDLNFEHTPQDIPWKFRGYLRYFFPKFAKKATKIVTVSHFSKNDIVQKYAIDPEKVVVAWNGVAREFIPLSSENQSLVRSKYTHGNAYFLFVGALHPRKNVARLLQAFNQYKQQGGMHQLVIVGENLFHSRPDYLVHLDEKTRNEIVFTGHLSLSELTQVTAAAFAMVFVPYFEGFGIPLVEAMKCGVPIIAGNLTSLPEVCGEAAWYVDPFSVDEIANGMMHLSENSELRSALIEKGLIRAEVFSWEKSASIIWETIQSALANKN